MVDLDKNVILNELHRIKKDDTLLVPNEVQGNVLCSNSASQLCTSLSISNEEIEIDYTGLKLLLKDLARKILQYEYEKHRRSGVNLH